MTACVRALLYVAADLDGRPRLLAAIERGAAEGGVEARLLPDPVRISERDLRGRRAALGALFEPHSASSEAEFADIAAHLLPLPELGAPAEPAAVDLRLVGVEAAAFQPRWPAPGGGDFEVRCAPLRLPGDRVGALLAARGAPHGPWLRPIGAVGPEVAALLRLVGELGVRTPEPDLFANWLGAAVDDGGAGLAGEALGTTLTELRRALREALLPGTATERDGVRVESRADGPRLTWRFEVSRDGRPRVLELATARFAPDAMVELLAVVDARLEPYWLLVFDRIDGLGPTFVGLVDLRRYLVENLDELEDRIA